jgi:MbtH protein
MPALFDSARCLPQGSLDGGSVTDMSSEDEDSRRYTVVVNQEEQYSIWLAETPVPDGWTEVGKRGTKSECLAHIAAVWTDMRPLSLRSSLSARSDKDESGTT